MIKSSLLLAAIAPDSVAVNAIYARQLGHAGDHAIFIGAVIAAAASDPWADEIRAFITDALDHGYRPDESVMRRLLSGTIANDVICRYALRVIFNTHTNPMRSFRSEVQEAVHHVLLETVKREVSVAA